MIKLNNTSKITEIEQTNSTKSSKSENKKRLNHMLALPQDQKL